MTVAAKYVVVTPARNEEDYIEKTIRSVVEQTVLPQRYVVVSDGSTDGTDAIVQRYADAYDFITFIRSGAEGGPGRNFGSKVRAFNAGFELVKDLDYDFVGNLDADVSFAPDYFERLLVKFDEDAKLGLSGGEILEMIDGKATERGAAIDSVCGAVQLFRRACFEEIGGYRPLDQGGIDAAAEITARMKGWRVRHQRDLPVVANRRVMTGNHSVLGTRYNKGAMNQRLGYHPVFQMAVSVRHMLSRPWVLGGLWMFAGYLNAMLKKRPHALPEEVVRYLRSEQLARLGLGRPPRG